MSAIRSTINPNAAEFQANAEHMQAQVDDLNALVAEVKKGGGMKAEADLLQRALPKGAVIVTMDERGKIVSSPEFSNKLAEWRDAGRSDVAFVIGGADGIDPSLRAQADFSISLGKMVWPHMLARAMLTEQLYRAASILAGSPYHRV